MILAREYFIIVCPLFFCEMIQGVQLSSCLLTANVCPKFSKFFPNLTLPSLSNYPQDKNMTNQIEVILSNYPVPCMVKWPLAHLCVEGKTKTTNGLISCRKKIKFCIRAAALQHHQLLDRFTSSGVIFAHKISAMIPKFRAMDHIVQHLL